LFSKPPKSVIESNNNNDLQQKGNIDDG